MSKPNSMKERTIPAKTGIHACHNSIADRWVPAFAGMAIFRNPSFVNTLAL